MCGRYLFSAADSDDIRDIIRDVESRVGTGSFVTGEIFPSNRVPVLLAENSGTKPQLLTWGFPGFGGKGIIINSRAETASEKPMFRRSLLTKRCVVPSSGFFEWSHTQGGKPIQKYIFRLPGENTLYMAGLYNEFEDGKCFVILTTSANSSMSEIHDRMPVILSKEAVNDWIFRSGKIQELLQGSPILQRAIA